MKLSWFAGWSECAPIFCAVRRFSLDVAQYLIFKLEHIVGEINRLSVFFPPFSKNKKKKKKKKIRLGSC